MHEGTEAADRMAQAQGAYRSARREGWWRRLLGRATRTCNDLVDFEAVAAKAGAPSGGPVQADVPLRQIIGSAGRAADFDLKFLPRRGATAHRWQAAARALLGGQGLAPVRLYRVGEAHFVVDGHHRVSMARFFGRESIAALVIRLAPGALRPKRD